MREDKCCGGNVIRLHLIGWSRAPFLGAGFEAVVNCLTSTLLPFGSLHDIVHHLFLAGPLRFPRFEVKELRPDELVVALNTLAAGDAGSALSWENAERSQSNALRRLINIWWGIFGKDCE